MHHSNAILIDPFYIRGEDYALPSNRNPHQFWIARTHEAPIRTRPLHEKYDHIFNISVTQSHRSDVYVPYGRFNRWATPKNLRSVNVSRSSLVAWMVSNCNAPSRRMEYVDELKKHVDVDVYGKCGSFQCDNKIRVSFVMHAYLWTS